MWRVLGEMCRVYQRVCVGFSKGEEEDLGLRRGFWGMYVGVGMWGGEGLGACAWAWACGAERVFGHVGGRGHVGRRGFGGMCVGVGMWGGEGFGACAWAWAWEAMAAGLDGWVGGHERLGGGLIVDLDRKALHTWSLGGRHGLAS